MKGTNNKKLFITKEILNKRVLLNKGYNYELEIIGDTISFRVALGDSFCIKTQFNETIRYMQLTSMVMYLTLDLNEVREVLQWD